jgi:hypothetical protein
VKGSNLSFLNISSAADLRELVKNLKQRGQQILQRQDQTQEENRAGQALDRMSMLLDQVRYEDRVGKWMERRSKMQAADPGEVDPSAREAYDKEDARIAEQLGHTKPKSMVEDMKARFGSLKAQYGVDEAANDLGGYAQAMGRTVGIYMPNSDSYTEVEGGAVIYINDESGQTQRFPDWRSAVNGTKDKQGTLFSASALKAASMSGQMKIVFIVWEQEILQPFDQVRWLKTESGAQRGGTGRVVAKNQSSHRIAIDNDEGSWKAGEEITIPSHMSGRAGGGNQIWPVDEAGVLATIKRGHPNLVTMQSFTASEFKASILGPLSHLFGDYATRVHPDGLTVWGPKGQVGGVYPSRAVAEEAARAHEVADANRDPESDSFTASGYDYDSANKVKWDMWSHEQRVKTLVTYLGYPEAEASSIAQGSFDSLKPYDRRVLSQPRAGQFGSVQPGDPVTPKDVLDKKLAEKYADDDAKALKAYGERGGYRNEEDKEAWQWWWDLPQDTRHRIVREMEQDPNAINPHSVSRDVFPEHAKKWWDAGHQGLKAYTSSDYGDTCMDCKGPMGDNGTAVPTDDPMSGARVEVCGDCATKRGFAASLKATVSATAVLPNGITKPKQIEDMKASLKGGTKPLRQPPGITGI